eukprot:CAMPEP_0119365648 /NCGR_PEP_ID=MMETSP1334-20130426/12563_1 /TAXON_ID=127549 /ORGANISM="Calcidiscus leptoporus, Strain RCC1130" /LENGTH=98 /DNA_ID=CAMNT_0007381675 /DNA_START=450 /DNA_END=746 /DNA_ORIENTATION=+
MTRGRTGEDRCLGALRESTESEPCPAARRGSTVCHRPSFSMSRRTAARIVCLSVVWLRCTHTTVTSVSPSIPPRITKPFRRMCAAAISASLAAPESED